MRDRDKAILSDLQRFRCMSRDDIIDLHFSGLKNAVTCCNTVMKRLRRDGHVDANVSKQPYIYFPQPSTMRKTSQKVPHFLGIVDVYKQLIHYEQPIIFNVEPKYGKEYMEPDAFTIWRKSPFFIEVQNSIYSRSVMQTKIKRYELYFHSMEWRKESWQPKHAAVFPFLLIFTDFQYQISSSTFRIFQASSVSHFLEQVTSKFKTITVQIGSTRRQL
ncbi:replication-relaxation family protein [Bacillus cereus]|uniref:replication-relaxation family protein n=1 Tax=Bacillus cereus TaxID=1396 RepID=UPI00397F9133